MDHVLPVAVGGETEAGNLALACVSCSLRKAARVTADDPVTGMAAGLFNPRRDVWDDHFRWDGVTLIGLTPTGRGSIEALSMNRTLMLAIREEEKAFGRHLAGGTTTSADEL